jgi:hypothetical protein
MKKYIRDRYFRERGSKARILDIFCAECNTKLFEYQKDGEGRLLRCYRNRILVVLNVYIDVHENLACPKCKTAIGIPIVFRDGRQAYRLLLGKFYKRLSETNKEYE